jgi:lactam utilization protein B
VEVFSCRVVPQWSEDVDVSMQKIKVVWEMGKLFPVKVLQELYLDRSYMGAGILVEKNHYEQARVFNPDGFHHVLAQNCTLAVCISVFP